MKKSIILLACVLGAFSAKAQTVIESTKFTDNWSVGINAGQWLRLPIVLSLKVCVEILETADP